MKSRILVGITLSLCGVCALPLTRGQAPPQYGPGSQGAVFRYPGMEVVPGPGPSPPGVSPMPTGVAPAPYAPAPGAPPGTYVQSLVQGQGAGLPPGFAPPAAAPGYQLPEFKEERDPNEDIHITEKQGPWVICVTSYSGDEAVQLARDMVNELRGTYKLPAYVFNTGAMERRREYERVKEAIQRKREQYRKLGYPDSMPIRVPHRLRVDNEYAVVVGGYADDSAARRALDSMRKLEPPDPKKVRLMVRFQMRVDEATGHMADPQMDDKGIRAAFVNPFKQAFVGPNPVIKTQRPADWDKLDLATLQRLNRDEPLSLLNCPKPVTLVIRQFQTPTQVQGKESKGTGFFEILGFGARKERVDTAATSAHDLAEKLRTCKLRMEAYVLHTRYQSIVTVGSFDHAEDPAIRSLQQMVQTYLSDPQLGLMSQPVPWNFRTSIAGS